VAAADKPIEAGNVEGVTQPVSDRNRDGLHPQFEALMAKERYQSNDVAAGRAYTGAYVEYVHYA